jgi:hypothetical protein
MEVFMNAQKDSNQMITKPITLKDIILTIWARKYLLSIFCGIGLVLAIVGGFFYNTTQSKVSTIIELQWSGINSGEYPDGKRFDYTNLFESYIYTEAIQTFNITDVTSSDLRASVTVSPIIPSNIYQLIEAELLRGNQMTYYPNVFSLSISHSSVGLSKVKAEQVISFMIDKLREDFEKKYIQKAVVIDYTGIDLSAYDYYEAHQILENQIKLIENVIEHVRPTGANFVSTQLGIGFNDVLVRAQLISNIEIRSISARVNNYLLTKDVQLMITRYRYDVERLELELNKLQAIELGLENLIATYSGSTAVIIIPGLDFDDIEVGSYINNLYANLVEVKADIANTDQDIQYFNIRIDRLLGNDPSFIITPEQVEEETAKVELSIARTSTLMNNLVGDLEIILQEYNQFVVQSAITPLMTPRYIPAVNYVIFALVGLVFGGGVGLAYIFINYQKKQENL